MTAPHCLFVTGIIIAAKLMGSTIFVALGCVAAWIGAHSHATERYAISDLPVLGSEGTA